MWIKTNSCLTTDSHTVKKRLGCQKCTLLWNEGHSLPWNRSHRCCSSGILMTIIIIFTISNGVLYHWIPANIHTHNSITLRAVRVIHTAVETKKTQGLFKEFQDRNYDFFKHQNRWHAIQTLSQKWMRRVIRQQMHLPTWAQIPKGGQGACPHFMGLGVGCVNHCIFDKKFWLSILHFSQQICATAYQC